MFVIDNARRYAERENRQAVRKFEDQYENETKCSDQKEFDNYLNLLEGSQVPSFLENINSPGNFVGDAKGHVLLQKLDRLLEQLKEYTYYVDDTLAQNLQNKLNKFWEAGKVWEKENIQNRDGDPSTCFQRTEKYSKLRLFNPSESTFKTYVKNRKIDCF
jgi:hypothetical protein